MAGSLPGDSLDDLMRRRDALRQAAAVPDADAGALLDAVLLELDGAIEALSGEPVAASGDDVGAGGGVDGVRAERRLLHATFQQAPVPLVLLELDGIIRRANARAAELLGAPVGYATGKSLAVFADPPSRAALQSHLAAVARTGQARQARCRVLTPDGPAEVMTTADRIDVQGEPPLLVVSLVRDPAAPSTPRSGTRSGPSRTAAASRALSQTATVPEPALRPPESALKSPEQAIRAMARRMDMVTAVTRLLLDNSTFSEAVTLQRCARLLAGEIGTWAIVDMERGGELRRQFAVGPRDGRAATLSRTLRDLDPQPGSAPWQVHANRKPALLAHAESGAFGTGPDGAPMLLSLDATSLLCVPISDGSNSYGTLTLLRLAGEAPFDIADLALAEVLGEHLGIAIRVDRMFRHRAEVAEALQASLLPARLPDLPGLELAPAYMPATNWPEISGDFYDVFAHGDGWAVAIGDVCGKGQDAAAVTAAARHAIRALAHQAAAGSGSDRGGAPRGAGSTPAEVLAAASDVLLAGDYGERFVTAKLAFLRWRGRRLHVQLGGCGHPGPAVVRADGRVEILEGDGLPLGLFPDTQPSHAELELSEGDLLFFYTDGVTEARSAQLGFLEERLADELAAVAGRSAADTVRAVTDLVGDFSRGELRDDATILAVRVGAPGGRPAR